MNQNDLKYSLSRTRQVLDSAAEKIHSPITMFALPKAFEGEARIIQRNAIQSWSRLFPAVTVVLLGNEKGIAEAADEFDCMHIAEVDTNEYGTPLVSSAFDQTRKVSDSPILVYCNADVILFDEFVEAIQRLADSHLDQFVAIGQRTDLRVDTEIDFDDPKQLAELRKRVRAHGKVASVVCKEYFAFTRELYDDVPNFAVGRGNWDNWMVAHAKSAEVPVVSLTGCVTALHQSHGYGKTTQKTRLRCYVTGEEAVENKRLAGGRNLIAGSTSGWVLDGNGLRKKRLQSLNPEFWIDSIRFLRLMLDLLINRR